MMFQWGFLWKRVQFNARIHGDIHGISQGKGHLSGKFAKRKLVKFGKSWPSISWKKFRGAARIGNPELEGKSGTSNSQSYSVCWHPILEPNRHLWHLSILEDCQYLQPPEIGVRSGPHLPIFSANLSTSQVAVPKTPGAGLWRPGGDWTLAAFQPIHGIPYHTLLKTTTV